MGLRDKYNYAVGMAKQLRMDGSAEERDGKLYFNGTVNSEDEKNQIWTALKTIPDWQKDIVADIKVRPAARTTPQQTAAPAAATTYTVQAGDTLSAIAKRFLGDANDYMEIFNANKGPADRPGQDQAGAGVQDPAACQTVGLEPAFPSSAHTVGWRE